MESVRHHAYHIIVMPDCKAPSLHFKQNDIVSIRELLSHGTMILC